MTARGRANLLFVAALLLLAVGLTCAGLVVAAGPHANPLVGIPGIVGIIGGILTAAAWLNQMDRLAYPLPKHTPQRIALQQQALSELLAARDREPEPAAQLDASAA